MNISYEELVNNTFEDLVKRETLKQVVFPIIEEMIEKDLLITDFYEDEKGAFNL